MTHFTPGMMVEFSNSDNTRRILARVVSAVPGGEVHVSEIKTGRHRLVDPIATNMRPFSAAGVSS